MRLKKFTLAFIPAVLLFLIIILASFSWNMFDRDFYYKEFEKNQVELENRNELLEEVFDGLRGGDMPSFNEKENLHMKDVASLVASGTALMYILVAVFVAYMSMHYYKHNDLKFVRHVLFYASIIILGAAIMSVIAASQFQYFFIKFHMTFFTNDLWMLNPATDKLIVLFPQQFFMDYVIAGTFYSIAVSTMMLIVCFSWKNYF